MDRLKMLLSRLRGLVGGGRKEAELDEEIRFHLERLAADHERAGLSAEEARRRALLELHVEATKDEWREQRSLPALEMLVQDVRHAARGLRRDRAFTVAAVATLALGIGATTVVSSLIQGVLLRPLPYPEPGRLVRVFETSARFPRFPVSPLNFVDYAQRSSAFSGLGAYTREDVELSSGERPERLRALRVSPGYFEVLRARPAFGRTFTDAELAGSPRVVVLSHQLWRDRFGSDPAVIGRAVRINREGWTVVGVMPAGFEHVGGDYRSLPQGEHVDAWWPVELDPKKVQRGWHYLNVVGRLAAGVGSEQAEADLNRVAIALEREYPESNHEWRVHIRSLRDELLGSGTQAMLLLAGAVAVLLLIACANVASLLLARSTARHREVAVRHALGATRSRLVRFGLTEAGLLAAGGGLAGVVLARVFLPALLALVPADFPRLHAVRLDGGVLALAAAACVLATFAFGLAPAFQAAGADLRRGLHGEGPGGTASARTLRWRRGIVVAQVTLASALLVAAGLLARSFVALTHTDPGFRSAGATTFSLFLPQASYGSPQARAGLLARLEERLAALPGVTAAGATTALPWSGWDENTGFRIVGHSEQENEPNARFGAASPGFFAAVGLPLRRGRLLGMADTATAHRVVVINEALARKWFPDEDPLGRTLDLWGAATEIVGVVGDVKDAPADAEAAPAFYWPLAQQPFPGVSVVVRSDVEPAALVASLRGAVSGLDRELPLADIRALEDLAAGAHARRRFLLVLIGAFAGLALSLSAVGAYGVLAYAVERRRREIGIRLALGADANRILGQVLGQGLRMALAGVGLGIVLALALGRLLEGLLYGVSPWDPATLVGAALAMLLVSVLAAAHPAWRATRAHPASVLRAE